MLVQYALDWVRHNPALFWSTVSVGAYHLVGAAVDALDAPDATSGKFYRWFYKFVNRVVSNYSRARTKT
jgi:hypothetical protein